MTKKEQLAVKNWNIKQSKAHEAAQEAYFKLRDKYYALNGSVSCAYIDFIIEVATCEKTTKQEKDADLNVIIAYHKAEGRADALFDFLG